MSLAFKKDRFKVQIRRHHVAKILMRKRHLEVAHSQANQALASFLDQHPHATLPHICVLNYHLIDHNLSLRLSELVSSGSLQLDPQRPFHIALVNKLFFEDQTLVLKYFDSVTEFAEKIIFAFPEVQENSEKPQGKQGLQKLEAKVPQKLHQDLLYLPNCLLEFWTNFLSISSNQTPVSMRSYCTILKSLIKWLTNKSGTPTPLNKSSLCHFLNNFFKCQPFFQSSPNQHPLYTQIQDLTTRFRMTSMTSIAKLLTQKFHTQQFINLLSTIKQRQSLSNDLIRAIKSFQVEDTFFELLLDAMDNQDFLIYKDRYLQDKFIHSDHIKQSHIANLEGLSVQSILKQSGFEEIWKCKTSVLDTFNGFLSVNRYHNLFYQSDFPKIFNKLVNTYLHCTLPGSTTTSQVQKTICIIFYNILLLASCQSDFEQNPHDCLILPTNSPPLQATVTKCFLENIHVLSQMINETSFTTYDHIVQLVCFLKDLSELIDEKDIDEQIINKGRLIQNIAGSLNESKWNEEQGQKIVTGLFEYLARLNDCGFDFAEGAQDLFILESNEYEPFFNQTQHSLLQQILHPFRTEDLHE